MRKHRTINIKFPNKNGDMLSGKLEMPIDENPIAFGVFMHCFTCTKEFFAPTRVSKALADRGIAMLRFDFAGLGASQGDFSETTFITNVNDVLSAAEMLSNDYDAPSLLIGHSMGGANALAATRFLPDIKAVATIGSPSDPRHVLRYFKEHEKLFELNGFIEIIVAGRKYTLNKSFIEDMKKQDVGRDTRDFSGAVFVFQSPNDDMVSYDNAKKIYERATEPKLLIDMDDASHMLDKKSDADKIADILCNWIEAN